MITPALLNKIVDSRPKMNQKVCEGLAFHDLKHAKDYIHRVLKAAFASLDGWIKYEGYKSVDIREQFAEITRPRDNKRTYEMLHSDFVHVKYTFTFKGERMEKYLAIPYCSRGGVIIIRDSLYTIAPELSDNLFSIDNSRIYIPVTRSKLIVKRASNTFMLNDRIISADTYWSRLYNGKKDEINNSREPQIFNYALCKHGFTNAFKTFGKDVFLRGDSEETRKEFPVAEYTYCKSSGITLKNKQHLENLVLIIPTSQVDRTFRSLAASFFYMYDTCVGEGFLKTTEMEEPITWKRVLARHSWKQFDEVQAIERIDDHLTSISHYVDELVIRKLRFEGINATTTDELFKYLIENFADLIIHHRISGLIGKKLSVTPNVMYPLVSMIFTMMFYLTKLDKNKAEKHHVSRIFDSSFRSQELLHQMFRLPAVNVLESTTDLLILKTTSELYNPLQSPDSEISSQMQDPAYAFDEEMLLAHSVLMVTKAEPSARGRVNPFVTLGENNEIICPPELEAAMEFIKTLR